MLDICFSKILLINLKVFIMSLVEQYLITTKNLEAFLNAIINAQAPQKVTQKFIESLGFKSTNDRLFIGLLRGIGFIDSNGIPQNSYYQFLDQSKSKYVLADAIRNAYSDLFAINKKANLMSTSDVKNKLKTLFQGNKSDNVLGAMANTFVALCKLADFTQRPQIQIDPERIPTVTQSCSQQNNQARNSISEVVSKNFSTELHYNIQIHLPETRDASVYDAIFKSLKDHLL